MYFLLSFEPKPESHWFHRNLPIFDFIAFLFKMEISDVLIWITLVITDVDFVFYKPTAWFRRGMHCDATTIFPP